MKNYLRCLRVKCPAGEAPQGYSSIFWLGKIRLEGRALFSGKRDKWDTLEGYPKMRSF